MASMTCCRSGCSVSRELQQLPMRCLVVSSLYENGRQVCNAHLDESESLFQTESIGCQWRYNDDKGSIDYFNSTGTTSERVLSIRPMDDSTFQIAYAMHAGVDVPQDWIRENIQQASQKQYEKVQKRVKVTTCRDGDNKENCYNISTPLSPKSQRAIEDDEITVKKRKFDDVDMPVITSIDASCMVKLMQNFFSIPLLINADEKEVPLPVQPFLISIEGNIGAGKSTLLRSLKDAHPEWVFIDEPLDTWTSLKNEEGDNLLELFYKDQRRWGYTFQNCALLSRYSNIETSVASKTAELAESQRNRGANSSPIRHQVFFTERCLDTDHQVFAKMLHDDNKIDSLEYDLYERWFVMLKKTATPLSAILYVDTPAGLCSDRIKGRNRDGEDGIPLAYLQNLDVYQSRWIDTTNVPVLRVSSDEILSVENFVHSVVSQSSS